MPVKCHRRTSPVGTTVVTPASKLPVLLAGLAESSSSSSPGDSSSWSPNQRSPRSFAYDGAVGLGIVAAMNDVPARAADECCSAATARAPGPAVAPRSEPIPIASARPSGAPRKEYYWSEEEEEMELSESYTCVVSHVGGNDAERRRVYLDDDRDGDCWGVWFGVFSPLAHRPAYLPAADFLSRCFRCRKRLHGLDVFMYRGDKAFCSEECRCQQMISDDHREKCVLDAVKPFDCSASPCSTPLLFPAGVAAA